MDWDTMESILWQYYNELPDPKIDYVQWFYGDGGVKETMLTYHIEKKPAPETHWEREIETRPIWARRG